MAATDIKQDISDISQTASGLIQADSLTPILNDMVDLCAELGVSTCVDVPAMQALDSADAQKALVLGVGLFSYLPLSGAVPAGSFASDDGQGYWQRQDISRLSSLLDVVLSNPTDGQVIRFNQSLGKWQNGNQTISAVAWASLTGIPSQLSSISATDQIIKLITSGSNKNIGTAALGDDFVGLFPNGTSLTTALRSVVIAPQLQQYMTSVTDSVVLTTQSSLRGANTTPFTLLDCIIIGDVGDVSAYFISNVLEGAVLIGQDGTLVFSSFAVGGGAGVSIPYFGSGFNTQVISCENFNNGTRADFQNQVNIANLNVYASNAAALSGEGGPGFLYRSSAGVVSVTY